MSLTERVNEREERYIKMAVDLKTMELEHARFKAEQDAEWRRQQELWRMYERARKDEIERGRELDNRIANLISGIGEFIRGAQR